MRHIGKAMMLVPLAGVALFIGHQAGMIGSLILVCASIIIMVWIMVAVALMSGLSPMDMLRYLFRREVEPYTGMAEDRGESDLDGKPKS